MVANISLWFLAAYIAVFVVCAYRAANFNGCGAVCFYGWVLVPSARACCRGCGASRI